MVNFSDPGAYLDKVTFGIGIRLTRALGFAIILALAANVGPSFAQERAKSRADTTRALPPLFYNINGWEALSQEYQPLASTDPRQGVFQKLCLHFGIGFQPAVITRASLSPLEWPRVLTASVVGARRQREEVRGVLDGLGFDYREVFPLDLPSRAVADTIVAAIAADFPVFTNTAQMTVIYGYDRREPDVWWWCDIHDTREIILESERAERLALSSDDPASSIFWIVMGAGDVAQSSTPRTDSWEYLRTLSASARGVPELGIDAYPLSLRRTHEVISGDTDDPPPLAMPVDSLDPLGILRARDARDYTQNLIGELAAQIRDTARSQPLKLAQYHLLNAIRMLTDMAKVLYGEAPVENLPEEFARNWQSTRQRTTARDLLGDVLRSEKQALSAVDQALAAQDRAATKPKSPARRRSR